MRYIIIITMLLIAANSCTPCGRCESKRNYLIKVDTSKPYYIEGKYCVGNIRDTTIENDLCFTHLQVFDRRNGKYIQNGMAWFYNETDTAQLLLINGNGYKKLLAADYVIGISISNNGLLGFSTKKNLVIKKNTKMEISIYLGSSLQR